MKRERTIDGEQEKINYLSLHGELQIPVVEINQKNAFLKRSLLHFGKLWENLDELITSTVQMHIAFTL